MISMYSSNIADISGHSVKKNLSMCEAVFYQLKSAYTRETIGQTH